MTVTAMETKRRWWAGLIHNFYYQRLSVGSRCPHPGHKLGFIVIILIALQYHFQRALNVVLDSKIFQHISPRGLLGKRFILLRYRISHMSSALSIPTGIAPRRNMKKFQYVIKYWNDYSPISGWLCYDCMLKLVIYESNINKSSENLQ